MKANFSEVYTNIPITWLHILSKSDNKNQLQQKHPIDNYFSNCFIPTYIRTNIFFNNISTYDALHKTNVIRKHSLKKKPHRTIYWCTHTRMHAVTPLTTGVCSQESRDRAWGYHRIMDTYSKYSYDWPPVLLSYLLVCRNAYHRWRTSRRHLLLCRTQGNVLQEAFYIIYI